MHQPKRLAETKRFVRFQARGVVQLRIARDFRQTACRSPAFRSLHEFPAHPFSSEVSPHKPAFQIGDASGPRAIDTVAKADVGKSYHAPVITYPHDHAASPGPVR